ncbi:MAG: hypothetical protein MI784_09405 [Cytophagales bacterium]|nr:hypothetical protein [Cytophagales bacterium]
MKEEKSSASLLAQLHGYESSNFQSFEWALRVSRSHLTLERKPTLYVYHKDQEAHRGFQKFIKTIGSPKEVLQAQRKSIGTAVYQGLRIPYRTQDDKYLFIHDHGQNAIQSYRWKDDTAFEYCEYLHMDDLKESELSDYLCRDLLPLGRRLFRYMKAHEESGIWLRKSKRGVEEIYFSFPHRPQVDWLLASAKGALPTPMHTQMHPYRKMCFRNVGLSPLSGQETRLSFYLSVPAGARLPSEASDLFEKTYQDYMEVPGFMAQANA